MNTLGQILKSRIDADGAISLHDYMQIALSHPEYGYYASKEPFGSGGDFITAPEISQMFGELIGLWCVDAWSKLGAPKKIHLVELGPGNGTLMADILRSARLAPQFLSAADIHLVENSDRLKRRQMKKLNTDAITWHSELPDFNDAPVLLIANEFFDALPIHQYKRQSGAWYERLVACNNLQFEYILSDTPSTLSYSPISAKEGDIFETCPAAESIISKLGTLLFRSGGAALIIDYGAMAEEIGDSFQAVQGHRFCDPFSKPGEADLTAHVNFSNFVRIANSCKIRIDGPAYQGRFLQRLGIEARYSLLCRNATAEQRDKLTSDLRRLVGTDEMGTLFKVLALSHKMSAAPEGFGV
ncbi:class I SAM-dependent methyltransferase [Sneathiella sp.]|uniref:class I SAM-dependent methyltransferase n=1 Tax=Sneathiella sp. TaxID=1964365 RepID=UPI0035663360